jgi:hypothetical protein
MHSRKSNKIQETKGSGRPSIHADATIFRQKPEKLTVKILRSILTSTGQKLKSKELRRELLERVIRLTKTINRQDREVIYQLLAEKREVTRAAINAYRKDIEQPTNMMVLIMVL